MMQILTGSSKSLYLNHHHLNTLFLKVHWLPLDPHFSLQSITQNLFCTWFIWVSQDSCIFKGKLKFYLKDCGIAYEIRNIRFNIPSSLPPQSSARTRSWGRGLQDHIPQHWAWHLGNWWAVNHVLILTDWLLALTWHSQTGYKLPNTPTSSLVVASLDGRRYISHEFYLILACTCHSSASIYPVPGPVTVDH